MVAVAMAVVIGGACYNGAAGVVATAAVAGNGDRCGVSAAPIVRREGRVAPFLFVGGHIDALHCVVVGRPVVQNNR